MIFEGLRRVTVLAETLSFAVIVIIIHPTEPIFITLDTKVVSRVDRQFALSCGGLKQRLRHNNRSRNTIIRLIGYCRLFPYLDIREISRILPLR